MIRTTLRRVVVSTVRETVDTYSIGRTVRTATDAAGMFRALLGTDPREHFLALYLDVRHVPLGAHVVSIGTAGSAVAHPREVFGPAVALSASAIIIAHNHPSGDPSPSGDDRAVTDRMRKAGEILGIDVLDHVILGEGRIYSFAEEREILGY